SGFHVGENHVDQFPGFVPHERGAEDAVVLRVDDQAEEALFERPLGPARDVSPTRPTCGSVYIAYASTRSSRRRDRSPPMIARSRRKSSHETCVNCGCPATSPSA